MDHSSGLESIHPFVRRNIERRLIRERRLGLANRLLNRYHASLHSEVVLLSWSSLLLGCSKFKPG
jgi:hypothetical protein